MRVITGSARGRRLKTLEGSATRPTSDRVKETIFNIIQFDIEGRDVLDLFGGSGQLAIEAVSRGASSAICNDSAKEAIKVIRENVSHCQFEDKIIITQKDYKTLLQTSDKKFGLIFLDPPYETKMLNESIKMIIERDLLVTGGKIVCEGPANLELPEVELPYQKGREYPSKTMKITIYDKV